APAAQSHGALLGGAADRLAQLSIHLSERTSLRTQMADERTARAAERSEGHQRTRQESVPRAYFLAAGLCGRRRAMGLLRRGRQPRRAIWQRRISSASPPSAIFM